MAGENSYNLGALIKQIIAYGTALISFVVMIVNLIVLFRGQQTVVTVVMLTTAVTVLWISFLYFALAKVEIVRTSFKKGRETVKSYRYPLPVRRLALIGVAVIPLVVVSSYTIPRYWSRNDNSKFTILVADFESVDGSNYGVTQEIIEKLRSKVRNYPEVVVQPLNRVITAKDGAGVARELGRKGHASIILWGWCQKSQLTVHFDLLLEKSGAPPLIDDRETLVVSGPGLDQSFVVQTQASSDMTYLTLLTIGLMRFEAGDNDGAIDRWQRALTLQAEPYQMVDLTRLYRYIGEAYVAKGDYSPAISNFSRALELDPRLAPALISRGGAYYLSGNQADATADSDKAIELINEDLKEHPDNAEAYYDRGICYYHKKEIDHSIVDYSAAIRLKPDFVFALDNRAGSYFDKGNYEKALSDLNESIRLAPSVSTAYFSRGNVLLDMECYEPAIADYTTALRLNPEYIFAYDNRAYVYDRIGEFDEALRDYMRAIEMRPQMADGYDNRGVFYASHGSLDLALSDFNVAMNLSPNNPTIFRHRGMAYVQKGAIAEAMNDLNLTLTMRPNDSQALNYRGIARAEKGDLAGAIEDFTHALAIDPTSKAVLYNRSRAYKQAGNIAKADADRLEAEK